MTPLESTRNEVALQTLVTACVVAGLAFLLLPGTFLGVWNLISNSGRHSLGTLPAAWMQAHGHAQIFGWIGTMVLAIGQRVLPAFCGMRVLYSPRLMTASLVLINLGCTLRVFSQIPAYEADLALAWRLLPVSAVIELTAVILFALNLAITLLLPPTRPAVVR